MTGLDRDGYAVEGQEDGECLTLSFSRIEEAIRQGSCKVTKPAEEEKRKALLAYTGGYEHFDQLPSEQQDIVFARLAVVLAILEMEEEGWKLTQRAMSRNARTGTNGPVRKELMRRARTFAQGDDVLGTTRGGRVTTGFDWPQGKTLRKYVDLYLKYGRNPVALLDCDHKKGPQGAARRRMSTFQEKFIAYVMENWLKVTKPKLGPLVGAARAEFQVPPAELARGFTFPSITSIRTRIKAMSHVVIALGRSGTRQGANLKGAGSTDVRALMYGEKAEIDQTYLSIFTDGKGALCARNIDPAKEGEALENNEIRRLWLHFMVDIATRLPLAWIIAESADADHSHALLRMATRDKTKERIRYGCKNDPAPPAGLLLTSADNGTAIRNSTVYGSELGIGAIVLTGRIYHATDKPFVERTFGPIQWKVLNFLPGYTGSRPGELEGYDPKASAEITHDALYGFITRFLVDEHPFRPHRGTGMFGATPLQKFEEISRSYGGIEVPSARDRCLHLGVKRVMSTTSEGVNPFGIPFNSTALQRFAAGQSKKATVHIDPDFLQRVVITAEGHRDVIEANMTMTAFNDLNLEEVLDIKKDAAEANPKLRELHNDILLEARARRVRESGFLTDPNSPSGFRTIEALERQADRLSQVAIRPEPISGPTAAPGGVMDRTGQTPAHRVAQPPAQSGTRTQVPAARNNFAPIKDSKL
ncbi:hypothetical protein [Tabrizicola soli]|uniref:Integrase catalytic domain-containing protein n=1 Tax=Tabrizicola soli TaxID=2185115 RepID=A0ABV7DPA2_9RHOB